MIEEKDDSIFDESQLEKPSLDVVVRLDYLKDELAKLENGPEETNERYRALRSEYAEAVLSYSWRDSVFEENGKKGLRNAKGEIVVPAIYDDFCLPPNYYERQKPVGAQRNGKVALVARDGKGTPLTDFEFHYVEPIPWTSLYAVWRKEDLKHFALMVANKVFTPYEIQGCEEKCDGAMILAADGKYGLLAYDMGMIYISPVYDEVVDEGIGEYFTFVKDGKPGRVTLDKRFIADEEWDVLGDEEREDLLTVGFICAPER